LVHHHPILFYGFPPSERTHTRHSSNGKTTVLRQDKGNIVTLADNSCVLLNLLMSILLLTSSLLLTTLLGVAGILRSLLGGDSLGAVVLRHGLENGLLLLGLDDGDGIGERLLGAGLALGVRAAHDLDLDTKDTLTEENVTSGVVDEVLSGLTGVDHEAIGELHGLCASGTELARDNNLATLGAALHDETEDTIASTTDGKTVEELVAERLALGDGAEAAVLDLGGVERDGVLGELEALLDERGELTDAATLLSEDLLGVGGPDDDLGPLVGDANLTSRVSLGRESPREELGKLGVEDTVSDELLALGAVQSQNCQHSDSLLKQSHRKPQEKKFPLH
jgi:hypothetical protein